MESNDTTVIIDYGLGNLFNVERALKFIGVKKIIISSKPEDVLAADYVILPGVGAFGEGMAELKKRELVDVIRDYANSQRPILGICLGMQLMMSVGEEFGFHKGLDLIPGSVVSLKKIGLNVQEHKLPHYGWNMITIVPEHTSIDLNLNNGNSFYFVHSYATVPESISHIVAYSEYGNCRFVSVINKDNITGCQFHPERSGKLGLKFLQSFFELGNTKNKMGTILSGGKET